MFNPIIFCDLNLDVASIQRAYALIGIQKYKTCSLIIIHFRKYCLNAPKVGYGDVTMAPTRFGFAVITGRTKDQVLQEGFHEWILCEWRQYGECLITFIIRQSKTKTFPSILFIPELNLTDPLAFAYHFIQIQPPNLRAGYPMTDNIDSQQIVGKCPKFEASRIDRLTYRRF